MKCTECQYYNSSYMWNSCALTQSEYFYQQYDCTLVNDDGSINFKDNYFQTQIKEGNDNG